MQIVTSTKEIGGVIWSYRNNTNDLGIIDQVFTSNVCHLPEDMSGLTFIDIGAHIGSASALAAIHGAKVFAYEPGWENYQLLQKMIKENDLDVTPFCLGVGFPGIRNLYVGGYNTGINSAFLISPELDASIYDFMRVISLSEVLSDKSCDFMKIDVEGCEREILPSVLEMPERIHTISVEFHYPDRDILDKLREFYQITQFSNDGYLMEKLG